MCNTTYYGNNNTFYCILLNVTQWAQIKIPCSLPVAYRSAMWDSGSCKTIQLSEQLIQCVCNKDGVYSIFYTDVSKIITRKLHELLKKM